MNKQNLFDESDLNLTIPEAARYLRLSRAQVYLMVQRCDIPHVRLSERRVIIRMKDLQAWIESRTKSA